MKKLKLSFNNFPVKIFEQGFNWRFSAKFSTFKKKNQFTRSWSQMPLFRYLSATIKPDPLSSKSERFLEGSLFQNGH